MRAEIVDAFMSQFVACDALYGFVREDRPDRPPTPDTAGHLILATYARGSKTFQGPLRLAYLGQWRAVVHARLLALGGHVRRPLDQAEPGRCAAPLDDYRRMILGVYASLRSRRSRRCAPLDGAERDWLRAEFGSRHWTKLSMDALCNAVATEFPEQEGHQRLLRQVDALLHRHANLIVHNSFLSIGGTLSSISEDGGMTFVVGV